MQSAEENDDADDAAEAEAGVGSKKSRARGGGWSEDYNKRSNCGKAFREFEKEVQNGQTCGYYALFEDTQPIRKVARYAFGKNCVDLCSDDGDKPSCNNAEQKVSERRASASASSETADTDVNEDKLDTKELGGIYSGDKVKLVQFRDHNEACEANKSEYKARNETQWSRTELYLAVKPQALQSTHAIK